MTILPGVLFLALAAAAAEGNPEADTGYLLGPDDGIVVRVQDAEEISEKPILIGTNGAITLPMAGRIRAAGLTVEQLQAAIAERLKAYLVDPEVSVVVTEFRSQPVSVFGAVGNPGVVQIRGRKSLFETLSLAGGLRSDAGDTIKVTRRLENGRLPLAGAAADATGAFSIGEVSVKEVVEARNPALNIEVKPNDVITVPKSNVVYVVGEVRNAGVFPLAEQKSMTLLEALSMAGGLGPTAAPKRAKLLRSVPGRSGRTELAVNLKRILDGKATDVLMLPGDVLVVPGSTGKKLMTTVLPGVAAAGTSASIYGAIRY